MSTPSIVPMFSPDGTLGDIPYERVHDALAAGAKIGAYVQAPDGRTGVVPADRLQDAIKAGGKVVPYDIGYGGEKEGFWKAAGSTLGGLAQGAVSTVGNAMRGNVVGPAMQMGAQIGANDVARQNEGRSIPYRAAAAVGEGVGIDTRGMEEAANAGDTSGVLGHAAGSAVTAVAPLAAEGVLRAGGAAIDSVKSSAAAARTSSVRATLPAETANLPIQAVAGAERVFRAAAPVGSYPEFRTDLYKAAGDLAEVGRKVDLQEAKGGTIPPDMRVRATVQGINDHLSEMYNQERAPQIQRNADNPVQTDFGTDAKVGLEYLASKAGKSELQALAQKALDGEHLTLAEADRLERLNSAELRSFNGMSSQDRAAAEQVNPKIGALKPLDTELNQKINTELDNRGEVGIKEYGQRYAALSGVRDQLQARMNATELTRQTPLGRWAKAGIGGVKGIASASQAAVADVNIGRELQLGMKALADSGITPNRGTASMPSPVRGLLTPGATQLPQGEPVSPAGPPSFTGRQSGELYPTTTAQRLNRLLPASASQKIELQPSSLRTEGPATIRIEPTTTAQRLGRLLPEQAGGPHITPVPGALDFTPPVRQLATPTAKQASGFILRARGNIQLARQIAAQEGFKLQ